MRFCVLDSWRGMCACLVAIFHFKVIGHIFGGHFDDLTYDGAVSLGTFIHNSWLFVDFFFVLSGFIIMHSLGGRLDGVAAFISFVIRRVGRLWPTHLVMVAAILAYEIFTTSTSAMTTVVRGDVYTVVDIVVSAANILALIHALPSANLLWPANFFDINPPSWSISVELWTYIIFGLLLMMRWARPLVVAAVAVVGMVTLYQTYGQIGATLGNGLFRGTYGFFAGVLVYQAYQATARSAPKWRILVWAELPIVVGVVLFVTMTGPNAWSLAGPLVFGLAVWVFAFETGPVSRLMQSWPLQKLGDLSYTIYMTHSFVAIVFADGLGLIQHWLGVDYSFSTEMYGEIVVIRSFSNDYFADFGILVYLGLIVLLSALMSHWIEVPCRTWFNTVARRGERRFRPKAAAVM